MLKITINGTRFTTFVIDGEKYLCTGSPTGKLRFEFAGEMGDIYSVIGATSVVSARDSSIEELYESWLSTTEFQREVLGIQF